MRNLRIRQRASAAGLGLVLVLAHLATPAALAAQGGAAGLPPGTITGTIFDASTNEPLTGTSVVLEPKNGGVVQPAAGAIWSTGLGIRTNDLGDYRFSNLAPGEYRLLVRRLGFHPVTIDVDLRRSPSLTVSIALVARPVRLERAVLTDQAPPTFNAAAINRGDPSGRRLAVERYRQQRFLESDVRVLTASDVVDAVTLGETDVFRALHRMPGVTTRDDYTAELWTRGAPWSHTRVYYDGLPLFNPVHTAGVFSGVNPDALGTAFFHPGVRSASIGEGAASVVDFASRRWDRSDVGGSASLSVAAARLALGGPLADRGSWTLGMRRTYVDLVSRLVADTTGHIPYSYLDLSGRVDARVGSTAWFEASGFWERDDVWGTVPKIIRDTRGRWGNAAAQMSFTSRIGPVYARHTVGLSRFDGSINETQFRAEALGNNAEPFVRPVPTHEPTENDITYLTFRSRIDPATAGSQRWWSAGYELALQQQRFHGPYPRPYPSVLFSDTLRLDEGHTRVALWGEGRWTWGAVAVQAGVRGELPGDLANVDAVAISPRVSARFAATPTLALSAAYGRSYQYTQAIAPAGPGIGPDLHITDVWLMANDTIPVLRSDVGTVGAELWLGPEWLGSVTVYGRIATGVAVPDPTPGALTANRPIFVPAENRAAGVEFSVRRLAGPVTTTISYTNGVSEMRALDFVYPATSSRRHVLDATAMARISGSLRVGGAVTASSGARFTRFILGTVPCVPSGTLACPDTAILSTDFVEDPGAGLAPEYVTFDLVGEWLHTFSSWQLGVTLQLRNALNRENAVTYLGSITACTPDLPTSVAASPGVCDQFDRGLPLLPLLAVSAKF